MTMGSMNTDNKENLKNHEKINPNRWEWLVALTWIIFLAITATMTIYFLKNMHIEVIEKGVYSNFTKEVFNYHGLAICIGTVISSLMFSCVITMINSIYVVVVGKKDK